MKNTGIQLLLVFLILFIACSNQESEQASINNVTLSHYQKLTISPSLYKEYLYRDIFGGAIDFNFKKFRIPMIKNGTIRIEETSTTNHILVKTLHFKDSLLTKSIDGIRTVNFTYDDDKNLISNGNFEYRYSNGRLIEKERNLSIHTFVWDDKCVTWTAKDKTNPYVNNSILCFNENNKIIQDYSSFPLNDKTITEEFKIQYNVDTIISHQYVRTENKDTTVHHNVSNKINSSGLLEKVSTKVVDKNIVYESEYKYEISNQEPLIVSKFKVEEGQKKNETRYTFNKKGQLIEYKQVGKYGEKYKVIYNERQLE